MVTIGAVVPNPTLNRTEHYISIDIDEARNMLGFNLLGDRPAMSVVLGPTDVDKLIVVLQDARQRLL